MAANSFDPEAVKPPWIVFPALGAASLPVSQGLEEAWFDQVWRPFWRSLPPEDRVIYFDHWHASDKWRDAIVFFFETIYELDDD